jgi:membrane associated rhomboid family serine protease
MLTIASTPLQRCVRLTGGRGTVRRVIPLRDDNPTRRRAMVTTLLIVVNIGIYFLVQPTATEIQATVEFNFRWAAIPCEIVTGDPLSVEEVEPLLEGVADDNCVRDDSTPAVFPDKQVWLAVLFSMFLHGSVLHLAGNMLFLWVFGNNIEDHLGPLRYLIFYLVSGVVATAAHVFLQPDSTIPLVGASGAVAGVMGAYLVWFPKARVLTAFFVLIILFRHIQARWLLGLWFLSQFFINPNEGVAWAAHVGGFVFGVLIGLVVRMSRAARRASWRGQYRDDDPWHPVDARRF